MVVYTTGYYIAPTIIGDVAGDGNNMEEVLGRFYHFNAGSYEDSVRLLNSAQYGLSASLFTRDVNKAFSF